MNDILMILETDRVIIKMYNSLIANEINPVREKIAVHLKQDDAHFVTSRFDKEMKVTTQWKKDQELLEYLIAFIEESLKFMITGFFKRCLLII